MVMLSSPTIKLVAASSLLLGLSLGLRAQDLRIQDNELEQFPISIGLDDDGYSSHYTQSVNIVSLEYQSNRNKHVFVLKARNNESSSLECESFLEVTDLSTNKSKYVGKRSYQLDETSTREIQIELPKDFPPGNYSVIAVVDYGNEAHIAAADYELFIEN